MNDPTVVALVYHIEHGPSVDYSEARPLCHDEPGFRVTVNDNKARFEFKDHHATKQEAMQAISGYIRRWEVSVGLQHGPNRFRLRNPHAEIRDRNPVPTMDRNLPPGRVEGHGRIVSGVPQVRGVAVVVPPRYPHPPRSELEITPDVESMFTRYIGYLKNREPLPAMAYFCLTVLEHPFGKNPRKAAATQYQVCHSVLKTIGDLTANYGGTRARKAMGKDHELTTQQRRFLKEATKAIINRAAHKNHSTMPKITKSDLPQL